jgi:hypothetical protein
VLGAGGYVAGPMVLAARLRGSRARSPRRMRTSACEPLAAPLAERVFLALPLGLHGRSTARSAADPGGVTAVDAVEARAALGCAPTRGSCSSSAARSARVSQRGALDAWAELGPPSSTSAASATTPICRDRVTRADYILRPFIEEIGVAYGAADVVLARAGGSVLGARRRRAARRARPRRLRDRARTRRRTPAGSSTPAARSSCRRRMRAAAPSVVEELLADPDPPRRRWRRRCGPPPSRTQQRRSPMSSSASLAGRRIWIAGIGGAGMSGYALLGHAWGAEVAGWDRVETPYLRHLDGVRGRDLAEPPRRPPAGRSYVSTAFADRSRGAARRPPRRARLPPRAIVVAARTARRRRAR